MIETRVLQPGITLRCCEDKRFKTNCLSIQFVRPLCREEAAANALLSAVLLRGSQKYPDLRHITLRLDDLYGAAVGSLVRKVGDYQTTGFYCSFTEDSYALPGDRILEPVMELVHELLLHPRLDNGGFVSEFVESEKKNLLASVEAQKNDKRVYASAQLAKYMMAKDPSGIPRLGEPEQIRSLDAAGLYAHYQKVLRESRMDIFYVGTKDPEYIAQLLQPIFQEMDRDYKHIPEQTLFRDGGNTRNTEQMDVTQAKLQMGFVIDSSINDPDFVPMQVLNTVFGGGMTSKLFMIVREKMSLCYDIGSSYLGVKGILTVGAGMDNQNAEIVENQVLNQLEQCRLGNITREELESAKESLISSLRGVDDSPSSIENYYATGALSGLRLTVAQYQSLVQQVTVEQLADLAKRLRLHSVFLLKGVD